MAILQRRGLKPKWIDLLDRFQCFLYGHVFDEIRFRKGGTPDNEIWEVIPEDWICISCGARSRDGKVPN